MAKKEKKNVIVTYFEQRDIVRPIALGIVIVGVVTIWLPLSWVAYILATVLIPTGLITYIVAAARSVSPEEVPDQIKKAMRDYDAEFILSKEYREVLRYPASHECETHVYGDGSRYYKKLKNNSVISDIYSKSHFFFTQASFVAITRRVALCELDGATSSGIYDSVRKLPFEEIASSELQVTEYTVVLSDTKADQRVKQFDLVVKMRSGEEIGIPVCDDTAMTDMCAEINRRVITK